MGRYHLMTRDRPDQARKCRTYVYFARAQPSGLIKIGYSAHPDIRATSLRHEGGEPVSVLFTVPGNRIQERGFHKRFRDSRSHGEWFHESGRLHDFLKERGHAGTRRIVERQIVQVRGPTRIVKLLKPVFVDKTALNIAPQPITVGYARVSTFDQNLDAQVTALRAAGVTDKYLFVEKISALNAKRPQFSLALKMLERGDTLIVHSLSRLGRDVRQIHSIIDGLTKDGINWRSITEPHLNNSTPVGRLMLTVTGAMAQFERDQIKQRTKYGMDELRRKGVRMGRTPKISLADARTMVVMRRRGKTAAEIAEAFSRLGVSASAVYARTNEIMRKKSKS